MRIGRAILAMFTAFPACAATAGTLLDRASFDGTSLAQNYAQEVRPRLTVPDAEQKAWALLLSKLLANKDLAPQYVVLVDRNPFIQAVTIYWMAPDRTFHFIGASPASTGKPGRFDHFITPTGIFEHTIVNPDFRAKGTRNENGILGYGRRGMRVYDFGWQQAERGWGFGGEATMRLQMHATDPERLEIRLDLLGLIKNMATNPLVRPLSRHRRHRENLPAPMVAPPVEAITGFVRPGRGHPQIQIRGTSHLTHIEARRLTAQFLACTFGKTFRGGLAIAPELSATLPLRILLDQGFSLSVSGTTQDLGAGRLC